MQSLLSNSLETWLNSPHFGSKAKKRGSHRKPFPFRVGLAAASSKNLQLWNHFRFPRRCEVKALTISRPLEYPHKNINIHIVQDQSVVARTIHTTPLIGCQITRSAITSCRQNALQTSMNWVRPQKLEERERERGLDIIVPIYGHILPAWPVRLVN